MAITIDSFVKATGHAVDDSGRLPGILDEGDRVTDRGAPVSFNQAVEKYFKMNSTPVPPAVVAESPMPRVQAQHLWKVWGPLQPEWALDTLQRSGEAWPGLSVRVQAYDGWLSKSIAVQVEGPKDQVNAYLEAFEHYRGWVWAGFSAAYIVFPSPDHLDKLREYARAQQSGTKRPDLPPVFRK